MIELSLNEIDQISGGAKTPKSGTLARPTRGESEKGRELNDLAGALDALGSKIGIGIYDWIHS